MNGNFWREIAVQPTSEVGPNLPVQNRSQMRHELPLK